MRLLLFSLLMSLFFFAEAQVPRGAVGVGIRNPQALLHVNGEIKLGEMSNSPVTNGMIQYVDSLDQFQFYQGDVWVPLEIIEGDNFWEEYLSGIKPIGNVSLYLPNLVEACRIDTFTNGVISKGSKDSLLLVATLGSYGDGMVGSTITNNDTATIASLDTVYTGISVDEIGVVSIPISLANIGCFQGNDIDSVTFTIHNITTDELLIDSSNAVILFVAVEDSAVMYFDTNTLEPTTFLSGTDTTVSVTIASNVYNIETASATPIYNNTEYRLVIALRDSGLFEFDKISVVAYTDTSVFYPYTLVANAITGEVEAQDFLDLSAYIWDTTYEVTYDEFITLKDAEELVFPAQYEISDYRTMWKYQYTDSLGNGAGGDEEVGVGPIEPLLVRTINKNTIDEAHVKSIMFPEDLIYWSPTVINTADYPDTARGMIYGRYDTQRRIYMNCDWRSIQQYRWNDGSGTYNVARKADASDSTDRQAFYMLTPFAKDVIIQRRGTPDVTSSYDNSNIVIKKAGTFFVPAGGTSGTNKLSYSSPYPLYDVLEYWYKPGDNIVHSFLPDGTTIDSVANDTIYVSQNLTSDGQQFALISTDFAFVAVNYFTSATNVTVEDQFYDNRIHILLQSTFNDMYLNDGLSLSLCEFEEYSHNDFNELVASSGTVFSKNSGKDLFGVTVTDTLRYHSFLSDISGDTINPTEYMQSISSSSTLFGEISGTLEPIIFRAYDRFSVELDDSTDLVPRIQLTAKSRLDGGESSIKIKAASSVPLIELMTTMVDTVGAEGGYITLDFNGMALGRLSESEHYVFPVASSKRVGEVLRLETENFLNWSTVALEFTPSGEADATYLAGTITYDASYFYVKVEDTTSGSAHVWNRFLKTAW